MIKSWTRFRDQVSFPGWVWPTYALFALGLLISGFMNLPWQHLIAFGLLAGFCLPLTRRAFVEIFILAFAVWIAMALWQDSAAGFRLSARISRVFSMALPPVAYIITGLVPGLLAGTAAASAQRLRQWLVR